jgi:hypothetical protein
MPAFCIARREASGAPRISRLRACALAIRLDALDTLRWTLPDPRLRRQLGKQGNGQLQTTNEIEQLQAGAAGWLKATAWAVRRGARDGRRRDSS